jgi:hypothetical protein
MEEGLGGCPLLFPIVWPFLGLEELYPYEFENNKNSTVRK